jgi:hypothetical protein
MSGGSWAEVEQALGGIRAVLDGSALPEVFWLMDQIRKVDALQKLADETNAAAQEQLEELARAIEQRKRLDPGKDPAISCDFYGSALGAGEGSFS